MAKPGHSWSRRGSGKEKKEEEEEEEEGEDPVDAMIARTGCTAQHWALQECMAEQRDWRRCQPHVQALRHCMARWQRPRPEEPNPEQPQRSSPGGLRDPPQG
ncbi:cytochrome c oxidase assembly factor 4 homolog, mitochondrial [Anser cygnoides]|uniref:cytochrome c oxidase assembly factor 4 homolog, mitochondrial n=1 Tax=Anser cygnoides TaxID=8845 RepID=UPI0034D16DF7